MATTLTLTGTHFSDSRRASPGVLVRYGDIALQFDAGRATTLRLAEAGVVANALTAVFLTHAHSDHVRELPDLTRTRWLFRSLLPAGPLPVLAAAGEAADFVKRMLLDAGSPGVALSTFPAPQEPTVVWHSADRAVTVRAVAPYKPVRDAVAYRIDTPDAAVVVSGDSRVCARIDNVARRADPLVRTACHATVLDRAVGGTEVCVRQPRLVVLSAVTAGLVGRPIDATGVAQHAGTRDRQT
jgi:ribonuclease Z